MKHFALLYDLASKIPCFIYDPSLDTCQRGRVVDELVSSLDIPKTILDYAGVKAPKFMAGSSLRPLLEGSPVKWR
jgi:arylsulfatase A-like enzyme